MLTSAMALGPAADVGREIKPTVLVIDDDAEMLESLAMALEDHGYRVLTASNGRKGLRMFRQHQPDVVLTDIIMPEEDGIGTLLQVRRERPETRIIALSGQVESWNYLSVAKKLGADAAVAKGRHLGVLIETLARLLAPEPARKAQHAECSALLKHC